mgnify:CR=1 FL=1
MIEALALTSLLPPAALVAPVLVKSKRRNRGRSSRSGWVAPAVVVGTWVVLSDGRKCKVAAVLPDGRVYCSEVQQQ